METGIKIDDRKVVDGEVIAPIERAMTPLMLNSIRIALAVFRICFFTVVVFGSESFAAGRCDSMFQGFAKNVIENRPLFSMPPQTNGNVISARARIAIGRMRDVLSKTRLADHIELVNALSVSTRSVGRGISAVAIAVNHKTSGTTSLSEVMYSIDDFIIFSFPGDIQHSNRVFRFERDRLVEELPLGEFLVKSIGEPWVALSRSMSAEEATLWRDGHVTALAAKEKYYNTYNGPVYHFQLGLENAYQSPNRELLSFHAKKEDLIAVAMKKRLWASVNQVDRGVHGLLFEIVVAADQVSTLPLKIRP